ncbi:MAG: 5'/3'-nucleotidase SurE [Chlamydiales bacterium]|nr:5'/3'-nucleotidase SurE [Chlamydiales bacterium]
MKKPAILLVNDDGIHANGLCYLYEAVKDLGDVTVVAPAKEQSGKGLSITIDGPIKVEEIAWQDTTAYQVYGTPADCVKIAFSILKHEPDFILSGINKGCNSGRNVLYSGTVGGVIEGVFRNIPGIAFSCRDFHNPNYAICHDYIRLIFRHFQENKIPLGTLMNVNFPKHLKEDVKGIRYATQGQSYWMEDHLRSEDNLHHFDAIWVNFEEAPTSDVCLLKQGYVTVCPIKVSPLTDMEHFALHHETFNEKYKYLS